jgi:hypothetical protein
MRTSRNPEGSRTERRRRRAAARRRRALAEIETVVREGIASGPAGPLELDAVVAEAERRAGGGAPAAASGDRRGRCDRA